MQAVRKMLLDFFCVISRFFWYYDSYIPPHHQQQDAMQGKKSNHNKMQNLKIPAYHNHNSSSISTATMSFSEFLSIVKSNVQRVAEEIEKRQLDEKSRREE